MSLVNVACFPLPNKAGSCLVSPDDTHSFAALSEGCSLSSSAAAGVRTRNSAVISMPLLPALPFVLEASDTALTKSKQTMILEPTPIGPVGNLRLVNQVDLCETILSKCREDKALGSSSSGSSPSFSSETPHSLPHAMIEDTSNQLEDRAIASSYGENTIEVGILPPPLTKSQETLSSGRKEFSSPAYSTTTAKYWSAQQQESLFFAVSSPSTDDASGDDSSSSESKRSLKFLKTGQWMERYQELKDFFEKHGHSMIPNHGSQRSLCQWSKRQRNQYIRKKQGLHSTLTNEREQLLDQLQFVWGSHRATWCERFTALRKYQAKNGHCNVPTTFPEDQRLSVWVKCQRRQYKLFRTGRKSNMSHERIAELNALGFTWDPRNLIVKKNQDDSKSGLEWLTGEDR